jgi:hypothetical protein
VAHVRDNKREAGESSCTVNAAVTIRFQALAG